MNGGVVIGGPAVVRPAVDRALATLSQVWPRYPFASTIYQRALESYPDDCVQSAAEEWAACQKWPPKPVEMADEAKRFWRMRYKDQAVITEEVVRCPKLLARQQELREQVERLDKRARWLVEMAQKPCSDREALEQVEGMAGMAFQMAETDEDRQAIRDGRIGPEAYIAAVKAYREERRGAEQRRARGGAGSRAGSEAGAGAGAGIGGAESGAPASERQREASPA